MSRLPAPSGTARRAHERAPRPPTGSNWVPALRRSSASASAGVIACRVRAFGGHGVEGVADEDDARRERDLVSREAVGIALPVDALVARPHDVGELRQIGRRVQDPRSDDRVPVQELPLVLGEGPGLLEDRRGDRHLAHVVQCGGEPDAHDLGCGQSEFDRHCFRELCDADQMILEVRMALGQCAHENLAGLLGRRFPPALLVGVHALVRPLQRLRWRSRPRTARARGHVQR